MIRLLIVDDEELARKRLRQLLAPSGEEFLISEAANGSEALILIAERSPHILLLDVEMPQMNGFDVLRHVEAPQFAVIFQTAHDEFAVKAFAVNACDYLLKPVSPDGLRRALDRALARVANGHPPPGVAALLEERAQTMRRFVVKAGSRSRLIDDDEVTHFLSRDHVTYIHADGMHFAIDLSLNHLEKHTDRRKFLRLHRHCLVRIACVASFTTSADMTVTMKSGETFKVARDRHRAVREALGAGPSSKT